MSKPPVIYVKWVDHLGDEERWIPKEELLTWKLMPIETVAWLIHEDDEKIIIAHSFGKNNTPDPMEASTTESVSGALIIAKALIIEKRILNIRWPKK